MEGETVGIYDEAALEMLGIRKPATEKTLQNIDVTLKRIEEAISKMMGQCVALMETTPRSAIPDTYEGRRDMVQKETEEPVLSGQELSCMARILQGVLFMDSIFYGCQYCQHREECMESQKKDGTNQFDLLRTRLQEATGIYLGYLVDRSHPEQTFLRPTKG